MSQLRGYPGAEAGLPDGLCSVSGQRADNAANAAEWTLEKVQCGLSGCFGKELPPPEKQLCTVLTGAEGRGRGAASTSGRSASRAPPGGRPVRHAGKGGLCGPVSAAPV